PPATASATPGVPAMIDSIAPLTSHHPKNEAASLAFVPSSAMFQYGRLWFARFFDNSIDRFAGAERSGLGRSRMHRRGKEADCSPGRNGWFHASSPLDRSASR